MITTYSPPPQLWIDEVDAEAKIEKLFDEQQISCEERQQLHHFRDEGYVIFHGAVDVTIIDKLVSDLRKLHEHRELYLLRMPKGEVINPYCDVSPPKSRLLDLYVNNEVARDIALSSFVTRFMSLLYEEPPLLFQSLLFTWGTEHSIHTDNTYIVCDPPCALIACWFALEDIVTGSGELVYYPRSHKQPLVAFDQNRFEWRAHVDGKLAHLNYTRFLEERAQISEKPKSFLAKKGDVILWHANLVHYGADIKLENQTRMSFLSHYCPAVTGRPKYFSFFDLACKRPWKEGFYSSRRYDLRPGMDNFLPVYRK